MPFDPTVHFPLDVAAWQRQTAHLSPVALAYYLTLLLWCWETGKDLPVDPETQARIARCTDLSAWRAAWAELGGFWDKAGHGYRDPWLEAARAVESEDQTAAREQRAEAGRASAAARRAACRGGSLADFLAAKVERTVQREPERDAERPPERVAERDGEREGQRDVNPWTEPYPAEELARTDRTSPEDQEQERRAVDQKHSSEAAKLTTGERVLVKLAHLAIDAQPGPRLDLGAAVESVKRAAAVARVPYDAAAVLKALDIAQAQQANQTPTDVALRLVHDVLESHAGVPIPIADLNAEVWDLFAQRFPTVSETDRDDVMTRAWNKRILEAHPERFSIVGKESDHVVLTRRKR